MFQPSAKEARFSVFKMLGANFGGRYLDITAINLNKLRFQLAILCFTFAF